MSSDEKHLKYLSLAHFWIGGIGMLFSFLPAIHVVIGYIAITSPEKFAGKGNPPPPFFGWLFLTLGLVFIVVGLTCAICIMISGKKISNRRGYWFSFVMACVECFFMPFGTILGIFTIMVLSRESVKRLYGLIS